MKNLFSIFVVVVVADYSLITDDSHKTRRRFSAVRIFPERCREKTHEDT